MQIQPLQSEPTSAAATAAELKDINISIVVPTFREAENLPELVGQLAAALAPAGWAWELIVVDDNSSDGTPQVLATLKQEHPQLRFLIRMEDRGLSSAVLTGCAMARYNYVVVMDADLSHPPESVPLLVQPLLKNTADFVIGSRYVAGGRTEDWGAFRWLNSAVATALSRPFVGAVKDSMAGFFAFRRNMLASCDELNPIGYKIGLELLVKARITRITEVPIVFRNRIHGQSKLTLKEQFRYLEHLSRLYDYKYPKGSPRLKFLIVGAFGACAALAAVHVLYEWMHLPYLPALTAGLLAMVIVTLAFFVRYVRTQRAFIIMRRPYLEFALISTTEVVGGILAGIFANRIWGPLPATLVSLLAVILARYLLRKVFLHDVRGLHKTARPSPQPLAPASCDQA
ncbi:MAG: glycosyltransferase [Phycisphaerales bacterium]|nr:glycosyltransferase [Phycisphaerales bacterium]